jgi:hypothetical protein
MAAVSKLPTEIAPAKTNDVGDGASTANAVHAQANELMFAEVHQTRSIAGAPQPHGRGPGEACRIAVQQYIDTSPDIFKVHSGQFKGMKVPEQLRCGIFNSNIAKEAGLINASEVTVRAVELGQTMKRHGYQEQTFKPGKHYPDGTYIVGIGANDGTNSRHIAMVCGDRLIHTHDGKVVNWPIEQKFFPGAYDSMKVYIPPKH